MPVSVSRPPTAYALAAAILILLVSSTAAATWRARADSLREAADAAFASGDHTEAALLFGRTAALVKESAGPEPITYFVEMHARLKFMEGRALEMSEDWDGAVTSYIGCLDGLPEISDAVRIRLAECHRGAGRFDDAVLLLREVVDDGDRTSLDRTALGALAECYSEAGDHDLAIQWYRVLLGESSGYDERARIHLRIGLAQERRGDRDAARESYATAVNDFPRSRHSADALKRARKISRAFTDRYHQGLVHYNRRNFREAYEFFQYYLRHDDSLEFEHEAAYFLGRAHQRMGNFRTAAKRYEEVVSAKGEGEYFGPAWLKLAYCYRACGDIELSLATYDRALREHPDRDWSADVLWDKARLLEEEARWSEAVVEYARIGDEYPGSDRTGDALFRAALCLFKQRRYAEAEVSFADLYMYGEPEEAARALYWAGRSLEKSGRPEEAEEVYAESVELGRDTFHGRRSLDRLRALGATQRQEPRRVAPVWFAGGYRDLTAGEVREFARWLAKWYDGSYFPAARHGVLEELKSRRRYRRGDTFLALHMADEALTEFRSLESEIGGDPRSLDVLATYYVSAGMHKRSIAVSERIAAMSPTSSLSGLPVYLQKRICPRHFSEIVVPQCEAYGVDPNLFYSLMRQESLFEPRAVSWVGARGLSQIMPATGRWIARKLGDRGFRTSKLLEPAVNVRYGTYYLSLQLSDFDGDIERALAAYNGGPENVDRWWDYGGGSGVDVFVEDIGYAETAEYVRRVYLYYRMYEEIYGESRPR